MTNWKAILAGFAAFLFCLTSVAAVDPYYNDRPVIHTTDLVSLSSYAWAHPGWMAEVDTDGIRRAWYTFVPAGTYTAANIVLVILRAILSGVPVEPAKEATKTDAKPPSVPPAGPLAAALFVGLMLTGCTMSLERARADGMIRHAQPVTAAAPSHPAECTTDDTIQLMAGDVGLVVAPLSAASGTVAALSSGKTQEVFAWAAGAGAAVATGAFLVKQNFTTQWVELGCGE